MLAHQPGVAAGEEGGNVTSDTVTPNSSRTGLKQWFRLMELPFERFAEWFADADVLKREQHSLSSRYLELPELQLGNENEIPGA